MRCIAREARLAMALAIALSGAWLVAGCGAIRPPSVPAQALYSLADTAAPAAPGRITSTAAATAPALAVASTQAAAGFGSQRIVYIREPQQLSAYANSQWVDTPARMLTPLLVGALQAGGAFSAVVPGSGVAADLRLDTEILRLQHDFSSGSGGSAVRFSLRAYLVDLRTRRVLATAEFDEIVASPTEDAHGGVLAAQRAVQLVLGRLEGFCTGASRAWTRDERPSTRQGSP